MCAAFAELENTKYLTEEKLLQIVKQHEKSKNVRLLEHKLGSGAASMENASGELIKVEIKAKVDEETKNYVWMAKLPPQNEVRLNLLRTFFMEENEIEFYTEIIPEQQKLLEKRRNLGKDVFDLPYCPIIYSEYHKENDKGSILIMEHLAHKGYFNMSLAKKSLPMAADRAFVALDALAKFHALGYAHFINFPGGIEKAMVEHEHILRDYGNADPVNPESAANYNREQVKSYFELLDAIEEPGQNFGKAYRKFHEEKGGAITYKDTLYKIDPHGFNTVCHGDAHAANMVFKYENDDEDKGKAVHAVLLDLALTCWNNPCTDVAYFLGCSVSPQLKRTHLEKFLNFYHSKLTSYLFALGHDPSVYPFRQFRKDYDTYHYVGLLMGFQAFQLMNSPSLDDLANQLKDNLSQEEMEKIYDQMRVRVVEGYKHPQTKSLVSGIFMESVDLGLIKLEIE